jgi:hypothetical protein
MRGKFEGNQKQAEMWQKKGKPAALLSPYSSELGCKTGHIKVHKLRNITKNVSGCKHDVFVRKRQKD